MPLFLFFVMCQNNNKKVEPAQVFPSDTIPMQYNGKYDDLRMCILDGIVNDSLHFKVFFDTGALGNIFSISDSLKNLFNSDSAFVQIGKFKKQMAIKYYESNRRSFVTVFGKNTIMVGWKFFENKIIELDFKNQHLFVYKELPCVTEFSKTKITKYQDSQDSHLLIPAQVILQGKTIEDTLILDTGYNGYITLNDKKVEKQGIDTTRNTYYGMTTTSVGLLRSCTISAADTIKIGNLYVANQNMQISLSNRRWNGLLGTKTLQNFSVILDLINYDLYLKKIDN